MKILIPKLFNSFCVASPKIVTVNFNELKKTAKIRLNNPKKRNTLSSQAIVMLKQSLTEIQKKVQENKIKFVVLQGQGTVFCSGHDLKQISKSKNPKQIFQSASELMLKLRNFPVPTLCAINGIAAAAGFQLAMACDMIVATQKSTFSTPGVKWGLFCSTPGVELIRSINSQKKAMQMLLFGQSISAQEAFQYGLVNRVVSENKLQETVNQFVDKANNLSGEVIKLGKSVLRNQKSENIDKAYCIANQGMNKNIKEKQDCQQGLKAFSEKRHPHYKN